MLDFNNMGRLMELAKDIDSDDLLKLADKVDLPELLRVIQRLSDDQLTRFESAVRRAVDQPDEDVEDEAARFHLPFRRATVIGAGTMGAQIAAHLANIGMDVRLLDIKGDEDPNGPVKRGLEAAKKAKPAAFFDDDAISRIDIGNLDDDLAEISDADWIIEAVVERLDIKRSLMEKIEAHASGGAVISTNTSGIPIGEIAEGRSESFRRRFLGTHFFNPPRYLKLLEIIPTEDTSAEVVDRIMHFGRVHLGKGVVVAKDVPYFIGNRVGVYGQLQAMRCFTDGDYTIEEIDELTGPLVGRPRSATFRTADIVGLDVLAQVAENLHNAVPNDPAREAFHPPKLLERLVEEGALGAKSGKGFYEKRGRDILSVDPDSLEYTEAAETDLPGIDDLRKLPLDERLRKLFTAEGRAGDFFRETTLDLLAYAANRVPEVTDNPADVDRAIKWGFGWELGPFEMWDAIGFERVLNAMDEAGVDYPDWIEEINRTNRDAFYLSDEEGKSVIDSEGEDIFEEVQSDVIPLPAIRDRRSAEIWSNDEASLLDIGRGVALFEFRSRGNALGRKVMEGLNEAIDLVESDSSLRGLVVGNEGKNFAVGANLFEVAKAVESGQGDVLERYLQLFQSTIQRVRYARKPVVVAVHQRALGGACEMVMACPHPVASAESYIGLVELGVGLIPAGAGSMMLAARASDRAATGHPSEIQAQLQTVYENVAMARVAESALQAKAMGYLAECAPIVMNDERRLFVARQEVVRLTESGYRPPPRRTQITVLGRPTRAAFEVQLQQYQEGGFISEYDRHLGSQLALVMTGGDLSGPQDVTEDYLLELEREVFLRLLGEEKTQARIKHMLETGKPLRN
jgi:3-hydroxyacyl-CoA dehydrogenase